MLIYTTFALSLSLCLSLKQLAGYEVSLYEGVFWRWHKIAKAWQEMPPMFYEGQDGWKPTNMHPLKVDNPLAGKPDTKTKFNFPLQIKSEKH